MIALARGSLHWAAVHAALCCDSLSAAALDGYGRRRRFEHSCGRRLSDRVLAKDRARLYVQHPPLSEEPSGAFNLRAPGQSSCASRLSCTSRTLPFPRKTWPGCAGSMARAPRPAVRPERRRAARVSTGVHVVAPSSLRKRPPLLIQAYRRRVVGSIAT